MNILEMLTSEKMFLIILMKKIAPSSKVTKLTDIKNKATLLLVQTRVQNMDSLRNIFQIFQIRKYPGPILF